MISYLELFFIAKSVASSTQPRHTTKSTCVTAFSSALGLRWLQIGELRFAHSKEISFFFLIINLVSKSDN